MRRRIALLMVAVMILTIASPVMGFAKNLTDYDEDLQNAILKTKELFDITEEFDVFDYNISSYNGKTQFHLTWNDSEGKLGSISVNTDSTAKVTSYNRYMPNSGGYGPRLAKISKSEAEEIARKFVAKVNPEYINNIKYTDDKRPMNVNDRYYYITYTRIENNVPYINNSIRVSIDNMTGEVRNYYTNWDDELEFPDLEDIISIEEAKETYREDIGLQLVYKFSYKDDEYRPYLVYTNITDLNAIDAKTGEIVKSNNYYREFDEIAMENYALEAKAVGLTPAEKEAIKDISELLNEDEAKEIAKNKLEIEDDYELTNASLYSQWRSEGSFIWNIRFEENNQEPRNSISVSLDAKTGEIKSFYRYIYIEKDAKVLYDKEAARKISDEFIKKMQPQKYDEIEYVSWYEPEIIPYQEGNEPKSYSFNYIRKANGAYVERDGFRITVDTVTGEIRSYSLTWYEGELPTTANVLNLDKGYEVLFNDIGMELNYTPYYSPNKIISPKYEDNKPEIKLVYTIKKDKPHFIDANTGNILNHSGEVYKEETIISYSDIDKSYARTEIEVLAQYGIALPGDKFTPKSEVKQREFLYLLAKANNYYLNKPYSDDKEFEEELYNRLIGEGIVKAEEKAPTSTITKEEAVKFIIRALKYEKVASIKGIYTVNFKDAEDISPELVGHVAIANGLGIIKGYGGYLNPDRNISRAQAAIVIYNYLVNNSK